MKRTRLWSLAAAGFVMALVAGCSAGASSSGTDAGSEAGSAASAVTTSAAAEGEQANASGKDTVTLALNAGAPKNLDFTTTDGAAIPQALLGNVYQGLVALNDAGEIVPVLAKSWTVSPDGLTYTFDLVDNATFSNGDPFTAEDVKYSFEKVQSDAWTISLKSKMDVVDKIEVASPTQAVVTLKRPSNSWLYDMTTRVGAIFDQKATGDLATEAVGTGPYVVSEFVPDTSITLTARDDYWGTPPAVKTVTFQYNNDVNAQIAGMLSGSIDGIVSMQDLNTLDQFKSDDRFNVTEGTTTTKWTLSMNNGAGVFKDPKVRQAVNYAIDRQALLAAVTNGYGQVTGSFVPPTDPWFEDLSGDYPYDPEKAKALLKEAGAEGATIKFYVPNLPAATSAAQVVKSDLEKVGINAELIPSEFPAAWLDQVFTKKDYDMSLIGHVESRDLGVYADPNYYFQYDNPEVQALMASADSGTVEQQKVDLAKAMKIMSQDAASDWLYLAANINVVDKTLNGVPQNTASESLDVTQLSWS